MMMMHMECYLKEIIMTMAGRDGRVGVGLSFGVTVCLVASWVQTCPGFLGILIVSNFLDVITYYLSSYLLLLLIYFTVLFIAGYYYLFIILYLYRSI